ncbi:glycosyltransferase family 4 protein [Skermanella mucosa]|uniref:glycosyltransferase family 4 protein n=1 Tax=Skermanella mucosa TaxID=1789672 RepID=UPI00192B7095|nr:glycosyltransferase family 1 protein [Skermanella mucosa]UEM21457.1 glycosyltransferase family 4 protein [Skermanella mucosa]
MQVAVASGERMPVSEVHDAIPAVRRRDTMKVILNVESIVPSVTGIGRYTSEILAGLLARGFGDELHCFSHFRWVDSKRVMTASAEQPGDSRIRPFLRSLPYAYEMRCIARNAVFRRSARRFKGAVYHEPNYILKPFDGPCLVNCHDLSYLHFPEHHPPERVRYLERNLEKSLRRADRIITLSDSIRREVIDTFSFDPATVVTVPVGVDARFRPHDGDETRAVMDRHGLRHGRYILSVATIEPRKNLHGLLRAFMRLPPDLRAEFPLVLCGATGWRESQVEQSLAALAQEGGIRRLGYIPEADLPVLYAGAGAFAFPSFYEGFGLPPLEAMASGTPVLASATGSIQEVVGGAGLLVDPHDEDAIAAGLERILTDPDLRRSCVAAGIERARGFSWTSCVDRTISLYEELQAAAS